MTSAAETQRVYRRRQRKGQAVLRVPVHYYSLIEALLTAGRIGSEDAMSRRKVEEAAASVLIEWAEHWEMIVSNNAARRKRGGNFRL